MEYFHRLLNESLSRWYLFVSFWIQELSIFFYILRSWVSVTQIYKGVEMSDLIQIPSTYDQTIPWHHQIYPPWTYLVSVKGLTLFQNRLMKMSDQYRLMKMSELRPSKYWMCMWTMLSISRRRRTLLRDDLFWSTWDDPLGNKLGVDVTKEDKWGWWPTIRTSPEDDPWVTTNPDVPGRKNQVRTQSVS